MVGYELDVSSVSSNISMNYENYSSLFDAFKETHVEAKKFSLSNIRLKGLNNWLKKKVNTLEEELKIAKTDLENLEIIYKNTSCN